MERSIVYIALFSALIAALGLLPKLTLASGIPITAQSMGIMLCGTILGARRGALAVLLFLGLVAMGLPLLSGGRGGLGVFTTPWAGFLFAFPVAAFVTGGVMQSLRAANITFASISASILGGILVLYVLAVAYYIWATGVSIKDALLVAALPFILGDLIKATLTGMITTAIYRARPHVVMSR